MNKYKNRIFKIQSHRIFSPLNTITTTIITAAHNTRNSTR